LTKNFDQKLHAENPLLKEDDRNITHTKYYILFKLFTYLGVILFLLFALSEINAIFVWIIAKLSSNADKYLHHSLTS